MTLRKAGVTFAVALMMLIAAAAPANASTVSEKYYDSNGRVQGSYIWQDCASSYSQSSYYKCRTSTFDGETTFHDYGYDGRPSRLRIWAR